MLRDEELQRFKDFTFKEELLCYTFLKSSDAERESDKTDEVLKCQSSGTQFCELW